MENLDVRVVGSADSQDLLVIAAGELDAATAPRLRQAVLASVPDRARCITLDVERLTFMDVAGLTALEEIALLVNATEGTIMLRHPSRAVRYLLDFRRRFGRTEPWLIDADGAHV